MEKGDYSELEMLTSELPLEEIPAYLRQVCYPAGLTNPKGRASRTNYVSLGQAALQVDLLTKREDLTPEVVAGIVTSHLVFAAGGTELRSQLLRAGVYDEGLIRLLRVEGCSPSLLGSIMRVVNRYYYRDLMNLASEALFSLAKNPSVPVEVAARIAERGGESVARYRVLREDSLENSLSSRADHSYPDLAGLPLEMKLEVVSTLPLPPEWFVDIWPASDREVAQEKPGLLLPPVWVELTEEVQT